MMLLTHIQERSMSWLGTGISILRGGIKLVLWAKLSPLRDIMQS